jgi:hypothetical protein
LNDEPDCEFIASCGHLHWNPSRPDIKIAQTAFWLDRIKSFSEKSANQSQHLPLIVGGDFNSLPNSEPYNMVTSYDFDWQSKPDGMSSIIRNNNPNAPYGSTAIKFVGEPNLGKLCRWLRVLGINASTYPYEKHAAQNINNFFDYARSNQRIILTSSRTLVERNSCPAYCLVRTTNLEDSLVKICRD